MNRSCSASTAAVGSSANDGNHRNEDDDDESSHAGMVVVEYHVLFYKPTGKKVHKGRGVSKADGILTIRLDSGTVRLLEAGATECVRGNATVESSSSSSSSSSAPLLLYSGTHRDLARRCYDLENLENLRLGKYEVDVVSKLSRGGAIEGATGGTTGITNPGGQGRAFFPAGTRLLPSSRHVLVPLRSHQHVVPVRRPVLAVVAATSTTTTATAVAPSAWLTGGGAASSGAPRRTVVKSSFSSSCTGIKPLLPQKRAMVTAPSQCRASANRDNDDESEDASPNTATTKSFFVKPLGTHHRPAVFKRRAVGLASKSRTANISVLGHRRPVSARAGNPSTEGRAMAMAKPVDSTTGIRAKMLCNGCLDNKDPSGMPRERDDDPEEVTIKTMLPVKLSAVLRPHQREAVAFLLQALLGDGRGAILADEPGLGKTLTTIACIVALHRLHRHQHFCVVCPSSLVGNWAGEFDRWLGVEGQPKRVKLLKGDTTFNSSSMKGFLHSRIGQVVIMSYDLFRLHSHHFENRSRFELLVVDEGHRLKSTSGSLTLSSLERLPADARLLLSATPIQNNLGEFYALANFCRPGILGQDLAEFRRRFERPILRHAGCFGNHRANKDCPAQRELDEIMSTFLLRRLQRDVLKSALPPRTEFLLFCQPSHRQVELYQRVVDGARSAFGASSLSSSGCSTDVLTALTGLRKVCSHPMLLHGPASTDSQPSVDDDREIAGFIPCPTDGSSGEAVKLSGKLAVLQGLLCSMMESNRGANAASPDKVVIVSSFTSTLSLVESLMLKPAGYTYLRLDGTTSMEDRQARVNAFNKQPRLFCFLLSSKAGGCGLNLIGGNRLVLLDPSWNPADDIQAMGRIYRQGQTRSTTIYRMFTSGTIEEVMYQRQQVKNTLSEGLLDKSGRGGFSREEISDCLSLKIGCVCDTAPKAAARTGKPWPVYAGPESLGELGCADGPLLDVAQRLRSVLGFVRVVQDVEEELDALWTGSEHASSLATYDSDEEEEFEFDATTFASSAVQSKDDDGVGYNEDDESPSSSDFQFK